MNQGQGQGVEFVSLKYFYVGLCVSSVNVVLCDFFSGRRLSRAGVVGQI